MGKIKYINKVRAFLKKNPVTSIISFKKIVPPSYLYTLLNYLQKKGEIRKLTRGYYTIFDDPTLAVYCFKPSYIGLQEALSLHNLWEQETNTVILSVKKIRPGIRKILGNKVIIRRISSKYFFGFEYLRAGNFYVPVSDIEKTLIDIIYFKEKIDKDVLKNIIKKINHKKLNTYLKDYPKKIRKKILNLYDKA